MLTEIHGIILLQLLCTYLLDLWLPDLFWHPGRGTGRLLNLNALSLEYVHLLRATLTEPDICNSSVCCFQGCLPGRFSGEDAALVACLIPQGEVSGLVFFWLGYEDNSYILREGSWGWQDINLIQK